MVPLFFVLVRKLFKDRPHAAAELSAATEGVQNA
jgi:hypothetical protein